jgi:two-component system sensor histidine kinase QseC
MMPLPRSLQRRLLMLMLALVASAWFATAIVTWLDVRHSTNELLDGHLAQAAALLVVQQSAGVDDDDALEHGVDAPLLHRYAPKVAFQVFHEGRLAQRSANAPMTPMIGTDVPAPAGFATVQIAGTAWRVFSARGAERDVQVYVGERQDSRDSILWAVLRSLLWPSLVALPLLGLAAWWAVHRGVAPLRRLGRMLAEREPQALDALVLRDAPSEMEPMLEALNRLFGRITTLMESERRFTADAAHELRTPLAAIRAQAQVALAETDEARRRHALESTIAGCDRAARLIGQLLTLARLEAGIHAQDGQVDAGDIVRDIVAELAAQASARGQSIEVDAQQPCSIRAEATLLGVLVRNLVDNAIRYSPQGARVRIGVTLRHAVVELLVEDSGPGLADAQIARLGERFFRVLGSGASGSGLGWSIVRRIAAVQDAEATIGRSAALSGLAISIRWPAMSAASAAPHRVAS